MRVVIISFDALEYTLVEKYDCANIKQLEYGKIDLEPYFANRPAGRGGEEPLTPEVYATFITGIVPKRPEFSHYNKFYPHLDKKFMTFFQSAKNPYAMDVPSYSTKSWIDKLTGLSIFERYWRKEISLQRMEKEYYKYMCIKASYADLIDLLGYDLILYYFKESDKLSHLYPRFDQYRDKFKRLYRFLDKITENIVKVFSDEQTLLIVMSDHGIQRWGAHSNYGFWSSNKPLGRGDSIKITDWFDLVREWYTKDPQYVPKVREKPQDLDIFTDEEKKAITDRLREMGYLG